VPKTNRLFFRPANLSRTWVRNRSNLRVGTANASTERAPAPPQAIRSGAHAHRPSERAAAHDQQQRIRRRPAGRATACTLIRRTRRSRSSRSSNPIAPYAAMSAKRVRQTRHAHGTVANLVVFRDAFHLALEVERGCAIAVSYAPVDDTRKNSRDELVAPAARANRTCRGRGSRARARAVDAP